MSQKIDQSSDFDTDIDKNSAKWYVLYSENIHLP